MKILTTNSVTVLNQTHRGQVVVAGSHGGQIAGLLAAQAGVHAVILNDAGVGKDEAGIAALPLLQRINMAAATVCRRTVSMGQGARSLVQGVISHVNEAAARAGVRPGDACREAAQKLCSAAPAQGVLPFAGEQRVCLEAKEGLPRIMGCDSVCLVRPEDRGAVLVVGSHAAMHAPEPESALGADARAAFFHDAGSFGEPEGISRLPVLDRLGIVAAAVDYRTARIGDAVSLWESGRLSFLNRAARLVGLRKGMSVQSAAALINARTACREVPRIAAGRRS